MRVIQWATGSVGRTTLRRVIDSPDLELVGVYVTNPKKVGLDAGAIAKRPETGIKATDSIEEILALEADVVIHTPLILPPYERQNEEVTRLLASGKNVISTNGFYRPRIHGEDYAGPLLRAAKQGEATLAGSGLNPGVIAERLVTTYSALIGRIDQIRTTETFDASLSATPCLLFGAMGFGVDPKVEDLTKGPLARLYNQYYAEVFDYVADKLGTQVTGIEPQHQLTLAPHDIGLAAGIIRAGCVAGTTWQWLGTFANGMTMVHKILWTAAMGLHEGGESSHWTVEFDGRPQLRATLDLSDPDPEAPPSRAAIDATAAVIVNLIPSVVAAPAGFFDLPAVAPYRTPVGRVSA
jgi:hypothetical protein